MELLTATAAVAFSAGCLVREHRDSGDDRDKIETFLNHREADLRERYETTKMDYVAFGERIAVFEDSDTDCIMRDATDVDGIGPETAFSIE